MTATTDVVVIGLGAMGSATLLALARGGSSVIGVDRFDPPHDRGSTHGESRITRLAVAEGSAYVPLVRRSHEIWRELEAETGEMLMLLTGGLVIGEGDGGPSHGQAGFLGRTIAVAQAHGIAHEILDAASLRERFPQFIVSDADRGYFEPTAGVLFPERAVAAQLRLARAHGATVRPNETVLRIEPCGTGVAVTTDNGRIEAARAVLTAGAWTPGLAGGAMGRHGEVHRQTVLWMETEDPGLYDPARCPIYIWPHGAGPEDYLYGFPLLPGTPGVKVGSERYGPAGIMPDEVDRSVPEAEWRGLYDRHVAGRLRGVRDTLIKATTCLYTVTPDSGFVFDCLQDNGNVIVASACSGHGFKHSPAVGERLAALATSAAPEYDPMFGMARFGASRVA